MYAALHNTVNTLAIKEGESYTKKELDDLLKTAVEKSSEVALTEVRKEIGGLKEVIITESQAYAEKIIIAATSTIPTEIKILRVQLKSTLEVLDHMDGPDDTPMNLNR